MGGGEGVMGIDAVIKKETVTGIFAFWGEKCTEI